eukprot:CAMPEP_0170084728 /NCGR_PEP_ID=MMETSP0019_2-20121128/19828_1 /TAXON_ID=98059 /ORGANISM="Dinobryon sp., Strain UTEXLB2267" /LENGTH=670 /DNA_ID=CAMNT_0010300913 /DNA_START=643 /DNA_END=2652 /DNA_ORIENTATION=-
MLGYDMDWDRRFNSDDPSALETNQVYIPLTNDTFSSYQMSKYLGEYELSLLPAESSMKYSILRLHTVYGPKFTAVSRTVTAEFLKRTPLAHYNLLNVPIIDIIRLILNINQTGNMDFEVIGEPKQYQDMVYVSDAADAIMQAVHVLNTSQKSIAEPLQIGSGMATKLSSILDVVVQLIENCLGYKVNPFYFETHIHYRATGKVALTAKARNRLQGWQTKVNLVQGLAHLLASFARETFPAASIGSLLGNSLQCLAAAGKNTSLLPEVTRTTTAPVIAKPQDIRYPAPAGSIMDSLQKVFCDSDRKRVLSTMDTSLVPNRTLIVVLSSTRSHHITWNNFDRHLLKALDADLALSVLTEQQGERVNSFRTNAKYVWEINPPKDNDYMHFYNEIAMQCFNHSFDEHYAQVIHTINYKWSGWLGCIKASKHRACAALIWFFRWFAQQQILNERLYEKYSRIIITRSDFLWVSNHVPSSIITQPKTIYVPEASDWGGLSDRHYMMSMYDAIFSLHLAEVVVADKDPEKQKQWLKDNEFNYGKGNSEWANLAWHQDVLKMNVVRFQHTGMLVIDPDDPAVNTGFGQKIPQRVSTIYLVKYPDEYDYLKKHNFDGHVREYKDGTLVKGSGKSCFLIESGKRRPFNGLQSFINMGFDFDQVTQIEDEDLNAIPLGDTI